MNTITSADVSAWIKAHAAKIHENHDHVQIRVFLCQNKTYPSEPVFSVYCSGEVQSTNHPTIEACLEEICNITPEHQEQKLKDRGSALRVEDGKLESQAANL